MKPTLRAEIPEQTLKRIKWLAKKANIPEETVIVTALIEGTIKMQEWVKKDD